MATDNTEALLGGFQIGNTWAANRARKIQNTIDNKFRSEAAQDRLKENFGEDTVFTPEGRVDIIGSAANRKIKQEAKARAAGAGFTKAWDGSQIEAVPTPIVSPAPTPVQPSPFVAPPLPVVPIDEVAPIQPDAPRFIQVPDGTGGTMPVRVPVSAPPSASGIPGPRAVIPEGVMAPVTAPVVRPPVPQSMPDMSGWTAPQIAAFMHAFPLAQENKRKTQSELATEANRLAIQNLITERTAQQIAGRQKAVETTVEGRKDVADILSTSKAEKTAADNAVKLAIALGTQENKARIQAGLPPKLNDAQKALVTETSRNIGNKLRIASSLDNQIAQIDDPKLDPAVKFAAARNMYKTINSVEGKDAVNTEEAHRIGGLLDFNVSPADMYREGRLFPSMAKFIEQVRLKSAELKADVADAKKIVQSVYPEGYDPFGPAKSTGSAPTVVELFVKPSKVPTDKWDAMTPDQKSKAVQLFK